MNVKLGIFVVEFHRLGDHELNLNYFAPTKVRSTTGYNERETLIKLRTEKKTCQRRTKALFLSIQAVRCSDFNINNY
jgi:hypothetical protein